MQQPEAYISAAATLFDASGALTSQTAREFLAKFVEAFARWVEQHGRR